MNDLDTRLAEWFASGDTGTSSKAIALWLWRGKTDATWGPDTPRDAGDLARCLRLLERIPEWKARMPEMGDAGGCWPTFVKHWDAIVASFMHECGGVIPKGYGEWPDFSRTYALMRAANEAARQADNPDFEEIEFSKGKLAGCSVRFAKGSKFEAAFRKAAEQTK